MAEIFSVRVEKGECTLMLHQILILSIKTIFEIMHIDYTQIIQVTLVLSSPVNYGILALFYANLFNHSRHANDTAAYSAGTNFIKGYKTRRVPPYLIYRVYVVYSCYNLPPIFNYRGVVLL